MLAQLEKTAEWDLVIIGGGATGLGAAVDAASRGLKTLLIERADFAKGTSSRSTKLVHGGVRYLAQGNIKLVKEALRERGYLLKNAPHLCSTQAFVIPVYSWFDKIFYGMGLMAYDLLAGKLSLGATKILSAKKTIEFLPSIKTENLKGGILYFDGQFDDSRLAIDLAYTAAEHGATLLNYCSLFGFEKEGKKIAGIICKDEISGNVYRIATKSVINATGVFTDHVMQMDEAEREQIVRPSQGIHLVVNKSFFASTHAMMVPKTADGRVFFAVPWHDAVVLGTTDTAIDTISAEPLPLDSEIDFILEHFNKYNAVAINRADVQSVFVGLRPLVKSGGAVATATISRDHTIVVSVSGLVTITGGKWTTYRRMSEDAVNNVIFLLNTTSKSKLLVKSEEKKVKSEELRVKSKEKKVKSEELRVKNGGCVTSNLQIGDPEKRLAMIEAIIAEDTNNAKLLHENYPYTIAEIIFAIRHELAQTVEDLLARRTRLLFLDAKVAAQVSKTAASLLAKELDKDADWVAKQVTEFEQLAQQYLVS
jgi:glycerol-3-phosphate dehydrogenase